MRSAHLLWIVVLLATPGEARGQVGPPEAQPTPAPPLPQPQPYPPQPQPYPPQPYPPQQPYQPYPQQPYYAQPPPPRPYPVERRNPYGDVLGLGLRLGAIVPFGDEGYAGSPGAGMLIDLSFWYEAKYFAIEPRFGVRFDLVRGPNNYVELPLDVGGYFVLGGQSAGGIAFFVGGGLGARHIWETRLMDTIGSVLPARRLSSDKGWGLGIFGRAGMILARSTRTRVLVSVEYNVVTVVELNGFGNPSSLTAGIGFVL